MGLDELILWISGGRMKTAVPREGGSGSLALRSGSTVQPLKHHREVLEKERERGNLSRAATFTLMESYVLVVWVFFSFFSLLSPVISSLH